MSTNLTYIAVAGIPAAFFDVPVLVSVAPKQTSHRDRTAGTGMTDGVVGLDRRPRGIPL
jgi:hypothetical protein